MFKDHLDPSCLIGFVGLGAIGLPIARNLKAAGYRLNIYSRTRKHLYQELGTNTIVFSNPKEAAIGCKVFILCVSDDSAVDEILFGSNGAAKTLQRNSIVIDLSTISPKKAKENAKRLIQTQVTYLDAPVTGGTENAKDGLLTILLGGESSTINYVLPILQVIGKEIYHFGEVGRGQEVKAINQILVAGTYAALAEAIITGKQLGLPMERVIKALTNGAADSWALRHRSNSILNEKYPLGFKVSLHHKDLNIALEIAAKLGLNLPITNKVKDLEEDLIQSGYKDEDITALSRLIKIQE